MKRSPFRSALFLALTVCLWVFGPQAVALGVFDSDFGVAHAKGGDGSGGGSDDSGGDDSGGGGSDDGGGSGGGSGSGGGGSDDGGGSGSGSDDDGGGGGSGGGGSDDDGGGGSGGGNSGGGSGSGGSGSGKSGDGGGKSAVGGADSIRNGYFVRFRDGHIEAVRDGTYLRLDRRGKVVDQRRATSGDLARLEQFRLTIRRDDAVSTIALVNVGRGLIEVVDNRGWTETIEDATYMLTDPDGNRVTKRKATSRDRSRLANALR